MGKGSRNRLVGNTKGIGLKVLSQERANLQVMMGQFTKAILITEYQMGMENFKILPLATKGFLIMVKLMEKERLFIRQDRYLKDYWIMGRKFKEFYVIKMVISMLGSLLKTKRMAKVFIIIRLEMFTEEHLEMGKKTGPEY